jgi:hypothetical protein
MLFATPEVVICTENIVIPALGAGMMFKGEWLEYALEYVVQHLSVCLLQLIQPFLRNIAVLDRNREETTVTTLCVEGIWRIFDYRLPIVMSSGQSFLSPAKFERCVPPDMKIKGTSVSPTQSVD